MGPIRSRTYVIDKKLQYRLLGYNAIYFFITSRLSVFPSLRLSSLRSRILRSPRAGISVESEVGKGTQFKISFPDAS